MSRLPGKVLLWLGLCTAAWASESLTPGSMGKPASRRPIEIQDVGLQQMMNAQVPLDLTFTDERGQAIELAQYFHGKPVVLTLNYFECPMLCTLELNSLVKSMRALSLTAGKEFEVVTVSFDPKETAWLAAAKKAEYLKRYGRSEAYAGWHFLTGSQASIQKLADSVGFQFKYLEAKKEYSHPAAIMVLTPQGRVARYLLGVEYSAKDLKFGVMDAAQNKIGSIVDQVVLFCFHYDPTAGRYTIAIMNVIRIASVVTVLGLITFVILMLRRDRLVAA